MLESTARQIALWTHLGALLGPLVGIPGVLPALVLWLTGRDKSDLVDKHGKESTNFQITFFIAVACAVLFAVVTLGLGLLVVIPLAFVLWILAIIWQIQGALAASRGEEYRYPLSIRLIG